MNFGSLFNYDNPIWRTLGLVWDCIWLTILWAICSIPVVTIGPSTVALYTVTLKLVKSQEGELTKQFFKAFKDNLGQGIIAGLLMLLIGFVLAANIYFYWAQSGSVSKTILLAQVILAYVYLMLLDYIFAVIARFKNTTITLFSIAFVLSFKNFGWTLLMNTATICIILLAIFGFAPLFVISAGAIACINSLILGRIFDKFITDNNLA